MANPPLPATELEQLKATVAALQIAIADVSTNLQVLARDRERFALQHRYAMVLHADQANPHVHLVVKAESESGKRLHIDKAMLRDWREQFAALMGEQGVAALADEVRRFVESLPPAMSDRQALAVRYLEFKAQQSTTHRNELQRGKALPQKGRDDELTR